MQSVLSEIRNLFATAIRKAYPTVEIPVNVALCNNPKFGHYQCNNAMAIFKALKDKPLSPKAPREVAQTILNNIPSNNVVENLKLPTLDLLTHFYQGNGLVNVPMKFY